MGELELVLSRGGGGGGGIEPVLSLGGIRVGVDVGELELVLSLWGN